MYQRVQTKLQSYTGKEVIINYRKDTSDLDTLKSIIQHDEYKTKELGIEDGQVFIDIGSHIGGFPLLLSTISQNLGVYCYEPIPENYRLLFDNLQDNDLQGFGYCWQLAVACRFRPKARICYANDTQDGKIHKFIGTPIYDNEKAQEANCIDVNTITLTDIFVLNDIVKVKALKIDAETFEWEILADTPKEVLQNIEWIIGELHPHPTEKKCQTLSDFLKLLKGLFHPVEFKQDDPYSNNFFLKNKNL